MLSMDEAVTYGAGAVAVVGLACRLPGAAHPRALWDLLRTGRDAVGAPPRSRLTSEPRLAGLRGGFLDQVDGFDAGFFGVSPKEAAAMDPQQRLVLELAWEALEDAGIPPAGLAGTPAGVVIGAMAADYAALVYGRGDAAITRHTLAGLTRGILANRISYALDLRGPSLTVDTAQSSALVAVHLACESLRSGESEVALAGGVNLNLVPESTATAERFGGLSPDGRCFTFDARANGYARGEGGGIVVLKPLRRALADGDHVYAVILGSAVNNDGATPGLTVPDAAAQQRVVRLAVERAGVDPGAVQVVELHGTGTRVGDPIEAAALGAALGAARPATQPLLVGSVKTNIGHLEGAAGIAGLLKAVLGIHHREVPPSLNYETPNPAIDLDALNLRVVTEPSPWPRPGLPLVAGVSSFGVGGVNCHVVLAEPPQEHTSPATGRGGIRGGGEAAHRSEAPDGNEAPAESETESPAQSQAQSRGESRAESWSAVEGRDETGGPVAVPLVLSARDPDALREQAARLSGSPALDGDLSDVALSLATGRTSFEHRAVVVGADRHELRERLQAFGVGDVAPGVVHGRARALGGTVLVFPGQGGQWAGMGRALADASPVFAGHLAEAAEALRPYVDWSPRDVLWNLPGAAPIDRVDVAQPALFAVTVALARLWEHFGVRPDAVVGHSQGEIAAAHVAGALSLDDAAAIAVLCGQALAGISGRDGIETVRDRLVSSLAGRPARRGEVAFYSGVTGGRFDPAELDAGYWYRNLRDTVRFQEAVEAALGDGHTVFVEAGPHPVLTPDIRKILDATGRDGLVTGTLHRDRGDLDEFLRALGVLHVNGGDVDWSGTVRPGARRVPLPTYPFRRRRYWLDAVPAEEESAAPAGAAPYAGKPAPSVAPAAPGEAPGQEAERATGWAAEREAAGSAARHEGAAQTEQEPHVKPEAQRKPETQHEPEAQSGQEAPVKPEAQHERGARHEGGPVEDGRSSLDVVLSATAAVLGHADAAGVEAELTFKELGLDSLGAVELRDALAAATGLPLPATVTFDHPSPFSLSRHLRALSEARSPGSGTSGGTTGGTATGGTTGGVATGGTSAHAMVPSFTPPAAGDPASDEPIALVAMAGRWPGGADTPEKLWDLVLDGTDAVTTFPVNRGWDAEALHDPAESHRGTSVTGEGGFLHDADRFDAEFFGISPREAAAMDPQQRLLLEVAWETFERAGLVPRSLAGSRTGVFVGMMPQDYGPRLHETAEGSEGYALTGTAASVASGRIAYTFGFEGPAVTVDTACSSSLVALHLAVRSLRSGESDLALAGGVTVMSSPGMFTEFSRQGGLAPDGRCKAFSAAADGTGWAEGVGLLLVERLSDARRNGHPVLAVVRGTAINQDGASNGLTAPNGLAQQRVIRRALEDAGLTGGEVDAVEAHGTGTTLGDPIEAQALLATYGQDRERPLLLGSLKSNIGHTQAAAGVAGVMKMVLAMRHGVLPRTLHAEEASPYVDWSSGLALLTEPVPWPETGRPKRAGVSSFGISGTNAHVIIEQAPEPTGRLGSDDELPLPSPARTRAATAHGGEHAAPANSALALPRGSDARQDAPKPLLSDDPQGSRQPRPVDVSQGRGVPVVGWVVSARSPEALRAQAARLADHLDRHPHLDAVDIAHSLTTTRAHFDHRAVITGTTRNELLDRTRALADGRITPGIVTGVARPGKVAFVFTGQGSQRPGMGRGLYAAYPTFATAFDQVIQELDEHLAGHTPVPLREVLLGEADQRLLDQTLYTQPALFALQTALTHLLATWGITPHAVAGHSIGAIAAAHTAGILTLTDAAALVTTRARLMHTLPPGGAMTAINTTETDITPHLAAYEGRVTIAAANTPTSTVISGDHDAITEITQRFRQQGHKVRALTVSHAFHSPHMDPILDDFHKAIDGLPHTPPALTFVSDLTGTLAPPDGPDYWTDHLRNPVRFADATRTLHDHGATTYLEIGPDGILTGLIRDTLDGAPGLVAVPVLRRDRPEPHTALTAAAHTHTHGAPVDWTAIHGPAATVDLPTYAFQRRRHWVSPPKPGQAEPYDDGKARFWDIVSRGDLDALVGTLGPEAGNVRRSLGEALPVLASWHAAGDTRATLDSWRYRVAWRPVEDAAPRSGGRWLLVRTARQTPAAWAEALRRALEERGAGVTEAVLDGTTGPASLTASLRPLRTGTPYTGVVSLLGLDDTPYEGQDVALLQALDAVEIGGPLWLTTSGAVAAAPSDRVPDPARARAWGLGGVIAAERPERWGGVVDLPPTPDTRRAAYAVTALTGRHGESELAVRSSGLLARRLVHAPSRNATLAEWAPTGTVLVTGGTGALGAHVARRLARRGVPHLLLVSRRGLGAPGAEDLRAELTGLGARVTVAACDVADRDALAAVLASVPPEHPLTAVVHTAAVLDDGLLGSLTPERQAAVRRVKADGALALHELTRELPLTAFVLFSSVTGLIGNPGQGNYAPDNAYLDALAEHRRSLSLPATAIAWGHWDGEGIAGAEAREGLRRGGFPPMAPGLAVSALEEAVVHGETRLVVARADWATVGAVRPHPLLAELPEARAAERPRADEEPNLLERLAALPESERRQRLRSLVRAEIADVLGYASADAVDDDRGFRDQGFTSLSAVELRNRLTRLTGTPLPSTLVFDYPTPTGLVDHLLRVLLPDPEPPLTAVLALLDELETLLGELREPPGSADGPNAPAAPAGGPPIAQPGGEAVVTRLRRLVDAVESVDSVDSVGSAAPGEHAAATADLSSASDDELISFISNELGIS
ncbi:hypothetical protein Mame01_23540 [Microbispora amethystogenes]|nr:hypothetical protein Mame01_23540 [Microbispora amethystogenes]